MTEQLELPLVYDITTDTFKPMDDAYARMLIEVYRAYGRVQQALKDAPLTPLALNLQAIDQTLRNKLRESNRSVSHNGH